MSHNPCSVPLGNPEVFPLTASDLSRFWAKVRRGSGCWEWTSNRTGSQGYGQFSFQMPGADGKRKNAYAHRISWFLANGPIPAGAQILHRCDNPVCVRPAHLFPGDQLANMQDAAAKGRLSVPRPRAQKLTDEQCDAIVDRVAAGEKQYRLAAEFGVSKGTVSLLVSGRRRTLRTAKRKAA